MSTHMAHYMSSAQQGIGKNTREAKHHSNLCTARTDYKKALTQCHTRTLVCLEVYNINRTLRAFIKKSVGLRKTTLADNSKLSYHRVWGIPRGLNPLSQVKNGYGYRLEQIISHLLYMGHIRLYRNE